MGSCFALGILVVVWVVDGTGDGDRDWFGMGMGTGRLGIFEIALLSVVSSLFSVICQFSGTVCYLPLFSMLSSIVRSFL